MSLSKSKSAPQSWWKGLKRWLPTKSGSLGQGVVVDQDSAIWVCAYPDQREVASLGVSPLTSLATSGSLGRTPVRTVIRGMSTYYGLVENSDPTASELGELIPFPEGTYQVRRCSVPSLTSPGESATFFAAALDADVNALRSSLESLGLEVQSVEVPATALAREFALNRGGTEKNCLLVHVTHNLTHLVVLSGGHPYLAREVSIGLDDFIYHVQMAHQCEREEAARKLLAMDLTEDGPAEPICDELLEQVRRTCARSPVPLELVLLSGPGALNGLPQRLGDRCSLQCELDGSERVSWPEPYGKRCHAFKMALGLAL